MGKLRPLLLRIPAANSPEVRPLYAGGKNSEIWLRFRFSGIASFSFPPPFSVCFFFNWAAGSLNEDEIGGGEIEEEERKNKTL